MQTTHKHFFIKTPKFMDIKRVYYENQIRRRGGYKIPQKSHFWTIIMIWVTLDIERFRQQRYEAYISKFKIRI